MRRRRLRRAPRGGGRRRRRRHLAPRQALPRQARRARGGRLARAHFYSTILCS